MVKRNTLIQIPGSIEAKNRVSDSVLSRWESVRAEALAGDNVISVYDVIGSDFFGEGVTAKRISAALRAIGEDKDVVVAINSPGGDFFEGAAIYNLLAQHKGKVTVKVTGLAASAASVIAMAGDVIEVSQVGFLVIHNAWACMCGNRHDLTKYAETLGKFDASMRDLYATRTGMDVADIEAMMDSEAWIGAGEAVEKGFADSIIEVKKIDEDEESRDKKSKAMARRTIEMALAKQGLSRKEREEIFQTASVRDAAMPTQRDAGAEDEAWSDLVKFLKS